jgi:hypothetical protein
MTNELNEWLAEFMGWHVQYNIEKKKYYYAEYKKSNFIMIDFLNYVIPVDDWNPTEDLNQAFQCLNYWKAEKLNYYKITGIAEGGYEITLLKQGIGKTSKHKLEDEICTEYSVNLPLAICQALYKTMEG